MKSTWWTGGLYLDELRSIDRAGADSGSEVGGSSVADATARLLAAATDGEDDRAAISDLVALPWSSITALLDTPPRQRLPIRGRPEWAAPFRSSRWDRTLIAGTPFEAELSSTSHAVDGCVAELLTALEAPLAELGDALDREVADILGTVLAKLVYVLDRNVTGGDVALDAAPPLEAINRWWMDRPAMLRHARGVSAASVGALRRLVDGLRERPNFLQPGNVDGVLVEPLDLHRSGTTPIYLIGAGGGVLHPRPMPGLDLFKLLLREFRQHGRLMAFDAPRSADGRHGTWVEWVPGEDLNDISQSRRIGIASDIAELAACLWVLGGSGFEIDGVRVVGDRLSLVQLDGLIAPMLGSTDLEHELDSWLDLMFGDHPGAPGLRLPAPVFREVVIDAFTATVEVARFVVDNCRPLLREEHPMRVFTRPMAAYSHLLRAVPLIPAAGDALHRDMVLSRIRNVPPVFDAGHTPWTRHELEDLRRFDLPYLTCTPTGTRVEFGGGRYSDDLVEVTGIDQVERRLDFARSGRLEYRLRRFEELLH